jgi:hypothetical protein
MLGGGIAGLILTYAVFHWNSLPPPTIYGLFAFAGGLYGIFAGVGVRILLPSFSIIKIIAYAALVSCGFTLISPIFTPAILEAIITSLSLIFIFSPPITGLVAGKLARHLIANAGRFTLKYGEPAWSGAPIIFIVTFFFAMFCLFPILYSFVDEVPQLISLSSLLPAGFVAGTVAALYSGFISLDNVVKGLASINVNPESLSSLEREP